MADDETPSSSRPSLSETRDTAPSQQEPIIPLFNQHLKIFSSSYLNFFEERRKIEEAYVDSLTRLYKKIKAIDAYFDTNSRPSTCRTAWSEVRDNVEREVQTRQAFINTLTIDVVSPLSKMTDTQERTRKRIKEDLKSSSADYNDYADNVLPKLRRTYLKKCQDVEDHKSASAAHAAMAPSAAPGQSSEQVTSPTSRHKDLSAGRPSVTAPQPLRPLDRRPSGSGMPARNRSPSGTTALSDLAHQGKKQLNQLRTFLDKSNTVKDLGGRGDNNALRAVRSKREADEADKEYRRGVHWLETLRLRKIKIMEAAYNSLETLVQESTQTIKQVLEKYTDNMAATTTTQTQLTTHVRGIVEKISPERDASIVVKKNPNWLDSAIPDSIYYYNYHVGECKDLIFGVGLTDYATSKSLAEGDIPRIVQLCIDEVERRGLEAEGIYRVSGRHAAVQELQQRVERNEQAFRFNPNTDDIYVVSSLLKLYLRELPEPLFRFPVQERLQHSKDREDRVADNFTLLRSKMRRLPHVHQATLRAILEHLSKVAAASEKNKMDAKNLAIIFGAVIFGEDDVPKNGDLLNLPSTKDTLMEDLIIYSHLLYDNRPTPPGSPPLPAAPADEPVPVYSYGSTHTKVANVPPRAKPPPTGPAAADTSAQDFTPKLPLRPSHSIHPSSRMSMSINPSGQRQDKDKEQQQQQNSSPPRSSSTGSSSSSPSPSASHPPAINTWDLRSPPQGAAMARTDSSYMMPSSADSTKSYVYIPPPRSAGAGASSSSLADSSTAEAAQYATYGPTGTIRPGTASG